MTWPEPEILRTVLALASHWVLQTFLAVLGALLADLMLRRVLNRLQVKLTLTTRTPWDEAVLEALRRPLSVLIWIVGVSFAADIVHRATGAAIFEAVGPLRALGVVVTITWFLIRLVRRGQKIVLAHPAPDGRTPDLTAVDSIAKLLRVSIVITGALVALQTLGFSISGVLAFGGIGGIAVGFAAKDLLANFFGGLVVYLDRPFAVGDWIRSPDREIEGTVEEIGWRQTRIRTFDQRPLYVPNAIFSTIAVENPSRMRNRRIYETIGIRYDDADKMEPIVTDVEAMLRAHPEIDTGRTLMVNFTAFAPSSLDFFVYTFTKTRVWTEFHAIKQDVLLKVLAIIDAHGAQVAFPTSTLHLPDGVTVHSDTVHGGTVQSNAVRGDTVRGDTAAARKAHDAQAAAQADQGPPSSDV